MSWTDRLVVPVSKGLAGRESHEPAAGWAKGAAWAGTLLFVGFSSMLFFAAIQQFSDVYARR